jgi:RNA polymerase sigma factor (sigma-70 family)
VTVDDDLLAQRFQADRPHLRAVATRLLGSTGDADDAVQEAWLRLQRSDTSGVDNLTGWLTTVVSRVCLDVLRSRSSRREEPWEETSRPDGAAGDGTGDGADPADQVVLADTMGPALTLVLDTLTPAERLAFVLHDVFAVPFDEIAPVVGRTPTATRQLASRARRRVQGREGPAPADPVRQRRVVAAFLAASRGGDFTALLELLDPDVVLRADAAAVATGAAAEVRGARAVAQTFSGRARAARLALVDGVPAAVWTVGGTPRVVFGFTVTGGVVESIRLIADPEALAGLTLELLEG